MAGTAWQGAQGDLIALIILSYLCSEYEANHFRALVGGMEENSLGWMDL